MSQIPLEIPPTLEPAYTNFADVFDNAMNDAQFIWSSNLILDNEVLMRYTLPGTTSVEGEEQSAIIAPNPATDVVRVHLPVSEIRSVDLFDVTGQRESVMIGSDGMIDLSSIPRGTYLIRVVTTNAVHNAHLLRR